ncbi:hypothetical protein [Mycobacterium montefiorense]|nr:hypothetical protein [Mycobacterium montefiorense]MCV7426979.1 hypothetical protein [Mycobacterium montefiorense]GLE51682.1 hypothetical protein ATCCBAA256_12630 [Mycobacterium montefiorense]
MTTLARELRKILESLQCDWPPLCEARTSRERYIATSIKAAIVMLDVCSAALDEKTETAVLQAAVREQALNVALGNYRLICRLIDQEDFCAKAFRDQIVHEVSVLTEQGAEISEMIGRLLE